jgi:hypothetical protein
MNSITTLTPQQLRKAADLKENIDELQDQLNAILGEGDIADPFGTEWPVGAEAPEQPANGRRKKRRRISPEGRANISAAAKARWAARRMGKRSAMSAAEAGQPVERPKRQLSAAHKRKLSLAAKARYARERRAARLGV